MPQIFQGRALECIQEACSFHQGSFNSANSPTKKWFPQLPKILLYIAEQFPPTHQLTGHTEECKAQPPKVSPRTFPSSPTFPTHNHLKIFPLEILIVVSLPLSMAILDFNPSNQGNLPNNQNHFFHHPMSEATFSTQVHSSNTTSTTLKVLLIMKQKRKREQMNYQATLSQ